ncbi:hypothetical protein NKI12_15080 [Mesorhizobium australicum]
MVGGPGRPPPPPPLLAVGLLCVLRAPFSPWRAPPPPPPPPPTPKPW